MNCDDYLAMLSTVPVQELAHGRPREHADTCRDCDRVTRVVTEREYNMVTAYDNLYASVPATQTAARSVVIARRKRLTSYLDWGIGIAIAASVLGMVGLRRSPSEEPIARVNETFRLQCLSPEQAAEILRPILGPEGSVVIRPNSPLGLITVGAPPDGMAKARTVLDAYDSPSRSECAVQVTVPDVPSVPDEPGAKTVRRVR